MWRLCVIPINILKLQYCQQEYVFVFFEFINWEPILIFNQILRYLDDKIEVSNVRFATLLFVWFVCQHIPVTKSLVMTCLSSILKTLTYASNNVYS